MTNIMARSVLAPKPLPLPLSSDRHRQIALRLGTARSPSIVVVGLPRDAEGARSLLVSVATEASSKHPSATAVPPNASKPDAKNAGSNPPTVVNSSGLSIQFPDLPSSWSTLLIGAALFLSVPIYRRIKRVEEVVEKAEEAADTAIEAIDKAAEEVGHIAADLAKSSSSGMIKEVALKVEGIAERIEKDAEMADEILHKVEHITEEVEELLEPLVESGEAKENEGKHEHKGHKTHTSINNSDANNRDV